jgi:hypothetical protein
VPDTDQAPVAVEIFERYLSGWGYNEIANHLNRPGGPAPPVHVDSARNTARKWSKTTIRAILENPVYTGRLYGNRLDFRAVKQGDGPLVRREREHWIQAERRHKALIPDDYFERVGAEMHRRRTGQTSPRRRTAKRFYVLGGIVHCAIGHNPLRMQGKTRKGNTYYACGYRISYGDKAAQALGHGKWQYVREDRITNLVDRFFATHIFGPGSVARFKAQHADLVCELEDRDADQYQRLTRQLADLDQRVQRQLAAIEAGVDAVLVGNRIRALKAEHHNVEAANRRTRRRPPPANRARPRQRLRRPRRTTQPPQRARRRRPQAAPPGLRRLPPHRRDRPKPGPDTSEGARLERLHRSNRS